MLRALQNGRASQPHTTEELQHKWSSARTTCWPVSLPSFQQAHAHAHTHTPTQTLITVISYFLDTGYISGET